MPVVAMQKTAACLAWEVSPKVVEKDHTKSHELSLPPKPQTWVQQPVLQGMLQKCGLAVGPQMLPQCPVGTSVHVPVCRIHCCLPLDVPLAFLLCLQSQLLSARRGGVSTASPFNCLLHRGFSLWVLSWPCNAMEGTFRVGCGSHTSWSCLALCSSSTVPAALT